MGGRLKKSMAAMRRSLSSCLDDTRMWRRTERASLEKKPSKRFNHELCLGVEVNLKLWFLITLSARADSQEGTPGRGTLRIISFLSGLFVVDVRYNRVEGIASRLRAR
jgi:hypothetical protein